MSMHLSLQNHHISRKTIINHLMLGSVLLYIRIMRQVQWVHVQAIPQWPQKQYVWKICNADLTSPQVCFDRKKILPLQAESPWLQLWGGLADFWRRPWGSGQPNHATQGDDGFLTTVPPTQGAEQIWCRKTFISYPCLFCATSATNIFQFYLSSAVEARWIILQWIRPWCVAFEHRLNFLCSQKAKPESLELYTIYVSDSALIITQISSG